MIGARRLRWVVLVLATAVPWGSTPPVGAAPAVTPRVLVLSLPTLVPVTVRPHDPRDRAPGFVIQSPLGQPLLVARVTPEEIQAEIDSYRAESRRAAGA